MPQSNVASQEAQDLTLPLEYLLTTGGDPRLLVDPVQLLNGYGCQPWPRPKALTFASSTATSISARAFAVAADAQKRLLESSRNGKLEAACDQEAQWLREQIRTHLQLSDDGTEIVFSPSGTDSQIHALYVAQTVLDGPLVTVIVGSDEAGSGTARAMTGRHFSSGTAQGSTVVDGERIAGFAEDITRIDIPVRNQNGALRSSDAINQEVLATVAQAIASRNCVVLHVMDTSKLGSRCPSTDCLRQIQFTWGRSVQVVVDACQMRLSRTRLQYYLAQNFLVFITGSKFLTGPPLSGALLVPAGLSARMRPVTAVPAGLELYTNQYDWPISWHGIRAALPTPPNFGQLLRWAAAAEEMRAYFNVPSFYRSYALREFSCVVPRLIAERPRLKLMSTLKNAAADETDDEEMSARTIFPFFITGDRGLLSLDACTRIYRALNVDVSRILPRFASDQQRQVAKYLCHIGQPVRISDAAPDSVATLRISAGARVVSDTWQDSGRAASQRLLDQEFTQVGAILDKIDLLLENLDALRELKEFDMKPSTTRRNSNDLISRFPDAGAEFPSHTNSLNRSSKIPVVRSGE